MMAAKRYDPLCEECHARPKMDRCGVCEECWYAPQHLQACLDAAFMYHAATGGDLECVCGAAARDRGAERV